MPKLKTFATGRRETLPYSNGGPAALRWIRTLGIAIFILLFSLAGALAQESLRTVAGVALNPGATDGAANAARFNDPAGLATDAAGNIYLADNQNHTIRRLDTSGVVATLAGLPGSPGTANGTGATARFDTPTGIALSPDGALYVTDTANHTIRRVTFNGSVTTFAGLPGESGHANGTGSAARFNSPLGMTISSDGTLYLADSGNHLIRKITPAGVVSTVAGEAEVWGSRNGWGAAARFNNPVGVAIDASGNLFISDANNFTLRKIFPDGTVTTFAGEAGRDGFTDGLGPLARFSQPAELTLDPRGNLYVADSLNHTIRKITPEGLVTTVGGLPGFDGQTDGANRAARLFNPYGLAFTSDGSLLVTDTYNQTLRELVVPFTVTVEPLSNSPAVRITWDAVIGRKYEVQYRDELDTTSWQNLGNPVTANSLVLSITDPAPATHRFYRVLREENPD